MRINTIFTFWEPFTNIPDYLKLCMNTWTKFDFDVVQVNYDNMNNYIDEGTYCNENFRDLTLAQQSDCVRHALIAEHGGIWMDYDTIVTKNVWTYISPLLEQYEVVFFGTPGRGCHMGFMAARKGAKLVKYIKEKIQEKLLPQNYEKHHGWDYVANSICNIDIINKHFKDSVLILDKRDYGVILECNEMKEQYIVNPNSTYNDFWCQKIDVTLDGNKNYVKDLIAKHNNQFIIMLHNSWISNDYKSKSIDQIFNSNDLLSLVLKYVVNGDL